MEQLEVAKAQILAELADADATIREQLLCQLEQIQRIQLAELSIEKGKKIAADEN